MSGLEKIWLLPNTEGRWRYVAYDVGRLERFLDIVYMSFKGSPQTKVDLDTLLRDAADKLAPPVFSSCNQYVRIVAYVGAPMTLDFSATSAADGLVIKSLDLPIGSSLNGNSGAFSWNPTQEGDYSFVVNAGNTEAVAASRVRIIVTRDRESAAAKAESGFNKDIPYV